MFNLTQIVNEKLNTEISNEKLNVQLEGKNPTNENQSVKMSAIQDPDSGQWYLATVPVGHVAFDEFEDKFKVDSRSEAKLLSESTFEYFNTGGMTRWVGENVQTVTGTLLSPVDISRCDKKMIIIKNNHDANIFVNVRAFRNLSELTAADAIDKTIDLITGIERVAIPANTTLVIDELSYPKISNPYVAILLEIVRGSAPTTGNVNVQFYGR